eukprot:TRINITY_DN72121_c0_g1_i1.p1 TRINITY_DN72121_c0_g1~~TRINITY_DN72121_c0_g1_i1.p1  ORF type:complete len:371 (+),score=88.25 TRINITY_DN72121_c0_g1_i1:89-1114(+)
MDFETMAFGQNEDMVECVKKSILSMTTAVIVDIIKEVALSRESVKEKLINDWLAGDYESQVQAFLAGEEELEDDSFADESTNVSSSDDNLSPIKCGTRWQSAFTKQLDPDTPAFLPQAPAAVGALSLMDMLPDAPAYVQQGWPMFDDFASPGSMQAHEQRPDRQQLELSSLIQSQATEDSKQQKLQRTLLIAYFPRRASEEDLLQVLSWVAKVNSLRIVRANTGESRCYCFAEFETLQGAEEAWAKCQQHRLVMNDESGRAWFLTATWARSQADTHARLKHVVRNQGAENTSTTKDGSRRAKPKSAGKQSPLSPGKLQAPIDTGSSSRTQALQVSLEALLP